MRPAPIRVMMLGLRGFPQVQGGVETHAEHLCPLLVRLGCEVTVLARAPYQPQHIGPEWNGVKFVSLWAPKSKGMEAILHSFLGVLYAAVKRPDILHIQAIGPAIMTLPARLLGLKVVVTHHGPDYNRQKWGRFARSMLQLGERWGMRWSNERIVISKVIAYLVRNKSYMESVLIPNGVQLPQIPDTINALQKFNLIPGKYILLVSRLVPEKRHHDLIKAFINSGLKGWKLVLVGASDHPDSYTQSVLDATLNYPEVVCTGFQSGLALRELYSYAGIFVLPSSHEGLPIALLEALSFGLPVIASDISANLEVGLDAKHYYKLGDVEQLAERIIGFSNQCYSAQERETVRSWVIKKYDWNHVAELTLNVYRKALSKSKP